MAEQNAEAADRLVEEIGERCEMLADFPGMGRMRVELAPGLLSFPVGRYLVFYRATNGGIEVIRVLHGARDIEAAFTEGSDDP